MPTSNNPIKFIPCSKSAYDNLQVKDENTLYFITDEYRIYAGSNEYTKSLVTLQDAPTSSTVGVDGKLYYYAGNHSLYMVHKVSANSYSWSQIANFSDISNLMSYTPLVNTDSELSALHKGQLFRYQDEIGIKTDNNYILLAKKTIVPSRTSQLINDSGFEIAQTSIPEVRTTEYQSTYIPDLTDPVFINLTIGQYFWFERGETPHFCMKTTSDSWTYAWWSTDYISNLNIPTATSELTNDSGFISHIPNVFIGTTDKSSTETGDDLRVYRVGDRYLNKSNGKLWVCSAVTLNETVSPAIFIYSWTYVDVIYDTYSLVTSYAINTQEADGYTLTGDYSIIGDTCFLRGTAKCISGETIVYYSLPEAYIHPSSTIAVVGSNTYTISTTTVNNTPVIEIRQLDSQQMTNDTVQFTLIYKCRLCIRPIICISLNFANYRTIFICD